MIIKKINISSFGKLKDFSLNPTRGLNVIYAPNESGKTTLLSFIKYIFYGTKQKKQPAQLSFKEKYTPWDMSQMGGSCEIEKDGVSYIIQRSENAHSSSFNVFSENTGENVNISVNPGIHFMGIGERAFGDSCFVTDIQSICDSKDGELISYLADTCDEKSTYSKIKQSLTEDILRLTSEKRKGSAISVIDAAITNNEDRLNAVNEKINDLQIKTEKLEETEDEINKLTKETELLKRCKNKKEYIELLNEEKSLLTEKRKLLKTYEDIKNNSFVTYGDEISPDDEAVLMDDFSGLKSLILSHRNIFRRNVSLFLVCFILFLLLFAGVVYYKTFSVFFMSIVTIALCVSGMLSLRSYRELKSEIKKYELKKYNQSFLMNKYNLKDRHECLEFISSQKDKKSAYFATEEQKKYLISHIERVDMLLKRCRISIDKIKYNADFDEFAEFDDTNFFTNPNIDDIINKNEEKLKELSLNFTRGVHFRDELLKLKDEQKTLLSETERLKKEKEDIFERADVIEKALYILDSAFSNAKDTLFPDISQKTAEVFKFVTSDNNLRINTNERFELSLTKSGYVRDAKFLSRGTLDILYFSLRIAIIEIMSENGMSLPLYLDDIFANCDDERTKLLLELIHKVSQKHQVFLCTCRRREGDYFINKRDVSIFNL